MIIGLFAWPVGALRYLTYAMLRPEHF